MMNTIRFGAVYRLNEPYVGSPPVRPPFNAIQKLEALEPNSPGLIHQEVDSPGHKTVWTMITGDDFFRLGQDLGLGTSPQLSQDTNNKIVRKAWDRKGLDKVVPAFVKYLELCRKPVVDQDLPQYNVRDGVTTR